MSLLQRYQRLGISPQRLLRSISNSAKESYLFSFSLSPFVITCILIAYFGSTFIEAELAQLTFDTLALRIFVCLWIVPYLVRSYWPQWLRPYGHILWVMSIGVVFPFCFGMILTVDAALSKDSSPLNSFALMEYVLSLFFLVQILFSFRLILVVWSCATISVFLFLMFAIDKPNVVSVINSFYFVLPFFLTILLVGGVISRGLFHVQKDKEKAVWNVANAIAHQLRTPLATIRNIASGTQKRLPELVDGYEYAVQNGQVKQPISPEKLEQLRESLQSISGEVEHSHALINILIANSKPIELLDIPTNPVTVRAVAERAIHGYPYNNPFERSLVTLKGEDDFEVYAQENMLLHVFYNLIGNAVEFSQKGDQPAVELSVSRTEDWNILSVRDTGAGVPKDIQHRIFDPFFSRDSQNGTGIGLSFCKSVMEGLGGKIECQSVEGEYCDIRLYFPKPVD